MYTNSINHKLIQPLSGICNSGLSLSSVFSSSSVFTHSLLLNLAVRSCWPGNIHRQILSIYFAFDDSIKLTRQWRLPWERVNPSPATCNFQMIRFFSYPLSVLVDWWNHLNVVILGTWLESLAAERETWLASLERVMRGLPLSGVLWVLGPFSLPG